MANLIRDDIDFAAYMHDTEPKQRVRPAREWIEELRDSLGKPSTERKVLLPWEKSHKLFAFRPGEVTVWAGINGHGKSLMTGQAVLSLMGQGDKVCMASFEMKPARTLERMLRQFCQQSAGGDWVQDPRAAEAFRELYDQFAAFTDAHLWMYDRQGTVHKDALMGVIRYCGNELGIQHVVIDNLAKCVKGSDDYNAQKDFVDELCAAARDWNVHVHLVHHIKKLGAETDVPNKFDVKGAGEVIDQVDNLLIVWRNKRKEKDMAVGKKVDDNESDALLICDKQRNGEWEGRIALWFERESQQFVGSFGAAALDFSAWPHNG